MECHRQGGSPNGKSLAKTGNITVINKATLRYFEAHVLGFLYAKIINTNRNSVIIILFCYLR